MGKPSVTASNAGAVFVTDVHVKNPHNPRDGFDLNVLSVATRSDGKIEIEVAPKYPASDTRVRDELTRAVDALGKKVSHFLRVDKNRISGTIEGANLELVVTALAGTLQEEEVGKTLKDAAIASTAHAARVKERTEPHVGSLIFESTSGWEAGIQNQIRARGPKAR